MVAAVRSLVTNVSVTQTQIRHALRDRAGRTSPAERCLINDRFCDTFGWGWAGGWSPWSGLRGRVRTLLQFPVSLSTCRGQACRWVVAQCVAVGELLGYARVSTAGQDPALQHDALSAAGCWRTWTDVASGVRSDRPQLGEVLAALRPGDTMCVWRLDRLGRSLPHLIDTVRGLEERGVGFRSLQEAIDTTTPGGRLVFHVFGSLAAFERELIQERTKAGLTAARARGRFGGRPTVLTPAKAKQAQRMIADGTPLVEVAAVVGVSRSTLYRRLDPGIKRPGP